MTTDDASFSPVVTSPSTFEINFQQEKDTPAMNGIDLFPNPPRQIDETSQEISNDMTADDILADLNNTSNDNSMNKHDESSLNGDCDFESAEHSLASAEHSLASAEHSLASAQHDTTENATPTTENGIILTKPNEIPAIPIANPANVIKSPTIDESWVEDRRTPNKFPLPVVSPALSISSYYSSAESGSEFASTGKKKKRKRHCVTCDLHFPHKADLLEHLKMHVTDPTIQLENLAEDDFHLQEYRDRQKSLSPSNSDETQRGDKSVEEKSKSPAQNETGGLKLKLKMSGSQNFQVVPMNQSSGNVEKTPKKPVERILTAREIKLSPPPLPASASSVRPLDAMAALSDLPSMKPSDENLLDNKYFECPTLDGLDQFAEEINNEAAEDLLKKLLEGGGQQSLPQENDWVTNSNEFISIDRLANMCTVCNASFPDAARLYDHKRITGHNFQYPMQPPPPPANIPNMDMTGQYHRIRHPFQQHMPGHMLNPPGMPQPCGPPGNIRLNFQNYPPSHRPPQQQQQQPRFHPGPTFNQVPQARRPPPLYRVPTAQNAHPVNMAPFVEMNPEMYIPSSNGGMMHNGHFQPNQPHMERQPVFFKTRFQRPPQGPRTPGMHERSPNATPSPPVILGQPTITRPRFLGPAANINQGPPMKKIKQEPGSDECEIVSAQPRGEGLPVIQSVQGGAPMATFGQEKPKDPIQLNDQITLSIKNKEQNKNPKDVANMLANRGIIVTHKPKPPGGVPSRETSPKTITQEAVQKLQLNNSVSIISKKKSMDDPPDNMNKPRQGPSAFISCPILDCEEKFLTQEGLNRHTQRGHKMGKMALKAFKCKFCPAMFSTQEGLMEHQKKNHRVLKTSADEIGIPIIDLRNDETKRKLAQLGIVNYIPLSGKSASACFGFPIVSVQGAANPNICNVLGMGVNSLLSLGPIKQIPMRKME